MSRPLSVTMSPVPAAIFSALIPPDASIPPRKGRQSTVIAFVIVSAPNPPGSMQLMMPPAAVFEIAPANVLHGAVRLHGFASSPTPETHVRVACAEAEAGI